MISTFSQDFCSFLCGFVGTAVMMVKCIPGIWMEKRCRSSVKAFAEAQSIPMFCRLPLEA